MRKLLTTLLFTMALAFSGMANALLINDGGTYDGTNVGDADTFLAVKDLANSGDQTEINWVNGLLGGTYTITYKTPDPGDNVAYYDTDADNTFAFRLTSSPTPDYFLVKNANYSALFANNAEFDWGVFDISVIGTGSGNDFAQVDMNLGGSEYTISHVTEFNPPASVPEPSISALLGLGLLGMIGVSRRKTVA